MDLAYTLPRSPRLTFHGVAMVARTADKARAAAEGTLGTYTYACRMSRLLFAFLETTADAFQAATVATSDDVGIERFVFDRLQALRRTASEVEAFNRSIYSPPTTDAIHDFLEERREAVPSRPDIWTYVDLIDAEEGREVPLRHDTPEWAASPDSRPSSA